MDKVITPDPSKVYEVTINNCKYQVTGVRETRPPYLGGKVRYSCYYYYNGVDPETASVHLLTPKDWATAKDISESYNID